MAKAFVSWAEGVKHVDAGTSASVEVESMMDDEEEVAQKNGESVNVEYAYMFETLTYCDQKYKREMGVNEMPASRYTSNSTKL